MERLERHFIGLIIRELDGVKINRACKQIGINGITVGDMKEEDFLNPEFTLMILEEVQEIRRALQEHMAEEEASGLYHWLGEYMPSDALTEAMIELNTIIFDLNELLEEL